MEQSSNTPPPTLLDRLNRWAGQSVMLKMATISILALLLLIPLMRVQNLVYERQQRKQQVVEEISDSWSGTQGIAAPALVIPYVTYEKVDNEMKRQQHQLMVLPETLDVVGDMTTEKRARSLFEVVLYTTDLSFEGNFVLPDFMKVANVPDAQVQWDRAYLTFSLSDKNGITSTPTIDWNGEVLAFGPGENVLVGSGMTLPEPSGVNPYRGYFSKESYYSSGFKVAAPLPVDHSESIPFQFQLDIRGSGELALIPMGKETTFQLTSPWPSPSFAGEYIPTERKITDEGFTAEWKVSYLNRGFPQYSNDFIKQHTLESSLFGVRLVEPVDGYVQTERSVKYGILIIALTFLSFFLMEVISKKRIHPFQYILVGVALVVFYTLLVAISEHILFGWAYLISAAATITLITFYISAVLKSAKLTITQGAGLAIIYTFIFVILRLEDYSLLAGSVGLFLLVGILMLLTRRVNW
ncbi:MAG: cell envelope integrity protein CreD, partial [Bacteroidota bacterium]